LECERKEDMFMKKDKKETKEDLNIAINNTSYKCKDCIYYPRMIIT